jgi:hypothetical protein
MALTVVRDCRVVEPSEVLLKHEVMQLTEEEKIGCNTSLLDHRYQEHASNTS